MTVTTLSDQAKALLIEKYTGDLDTSMQAASLITGWCPIRSVDGTDTISFRRFGKGTINKLTLGTTPTATQINTDKIILSVDTMIYMRNAFTKLGEVQQDINMTGETAKQHGKDMAVLFDTTFYIMAIKGSFDTLTEAQKLGGAFFDGLNVEMTAASDETDSDKVVDKMESVITTMIERDIDLTDFKWFVTPAAYKVIADHPKLINQDFSKDNGDFGGRLVKQLGGVGVVQVSGSRIPQAATTAYSTLLGNSALEVTATMGDVFAILVCPTSVIIGESVALNASVFWDATEKLWFVDSDRSYNVGVRNPGLCATVRKYRA